MSGRGVPDLIARHEKFIEEFGVKFNPRAASNFHKLTKGSDLWQRERRLRLDATQLPMVVQPPRWPE